MSSRFVFYVVWIISLTTIHSQPIGFSACGSSPCRNGAQCIDQNNYFGYSCKCYGQWIGVNCDVAIKHVTPGNSALLSALASTTSHTETVVLRSSRSSRNNRYRQVSSYPEEDRKKKDWGYVENNWLNNVPPYTNGPNWPINNNQNGWNGNNNWNNNYNNGQWQQQPYPQSGQNYYNNNGYVAYGNNYNNQFRPYVTNYPYVNNNINGQVFNPFTTQYYQSYLWDNQRNRRGFFLALALGILIPVLVIGGIITCVCFVCCRKKRDVNKGPAPVPLPRQ